MSQTMKKSTVGMQAVDRVMSYFNDRRLQEQGYMPERRPRKKVRSVGATVYPSKR